MIYAGTAQSLNGLALDLLARETLYQSCHSRCSCVGFFPSSTVLPALRANSCIAIDRLMIELLDFHIPFLSFTNAGFKGYGKNLLNRRLRITPSTSIYFRHFILTSSFILVSSRIITTVHAPRAQLPRGTFPNYLWERVR